jgi:hypothetical protein
MGYIREPFGDSISISLFAVCDLLSGGWIPPLKVGRFNIIPPCDAYVSPFHFNNKNRISSLEKFGINWEKTV